MIKCHMEKCGGTKSYAICHFHTPSQRCRHRRCLRDRGRGHKVAIGGLYDDARVGSEQSGYSRRYTTAPTTLKWSAFNRFMAASHYTWVWWLLQSFVVVTSVCYCLNSKMTTLGEML